MGVRVTRQSPTVGEERGIDRGITATRLYFALHFLGIYDIISRQKLENHFPKGFFFPPGYIFSIQQITKQYSNIDYFPFINNS